MRRRQTLVTPAVLRTSTKLSTLAGDHFTVRLAVAERATPPKLPVKVMVYVPLGALFGSVRLAFAVIDVPEMLTDAGETLQVVFAGPPLQFSATVPLNPLRAATVSV